MPSLEAPCLELDSAHQTSTINASPSSSEISSASSPEPPNIRVTPLFRVLAMRPPEPDQPSGQDELERRLPGYRRIIIPRELTLIEILKQSSGVSTDEEVLRIREVKLRVVSERVGLRRLHVLTPRLRNLTLDGSAIASLRDLGIGLVHLKILSINRCNITSLDGVWGLGDLRELYAAGNRLQDLQPLAALQKLHTLDLADNPIAESNRLWTLGVCGALRKLTLSGTPASNTPGYRSRVAAALPMLMYLDERPMHTDIDYDCDEIFSCVSSDGEYEVETPALPLEIGKSPVTGEPGPSTRSQTNCLDPNLEDGQSLENLVTSRRCFLRRPATTENAGVRPARPNIPIRPRTAQERPVIDAPTRLQILNTLMDHEWLSSGSKLTSLSAVCGGNITRALRRTSTAKQLHHKVDDVEQTMEEASRAAAAEIPRAPKLEDWIKFKEATGIEVDIGINHRPECSDPSKCLDRLEQIEKETQLRCKEERQRDKSSFGESSNSFLSIRTVGNTSKKDDLELWSECHSNPNQSGILNSDVNSFFNDSALHCFENRESFLMFPDNSDSDS